MLSVKVESEAHLDSHNQLLIHTRDVMQPVAVRLKAYVYREVGLAQAAWE